MTICVKILESTHTDSKNTRIGAKLLDTNMMYKIQLVSIDSQRLF